jgi:hypothetical protein
MSFWSHEDIPVTMIKAVHKELPVTVYVTSLIAGRLLCSRAYVLFRLTRAIISIIDEKNTNHFSVHYPFLLYEKRLRSYGAFL